MDKKRPYSLYAILNRMIVFGKVLTDKIIRVIFFKGKLWQQIGRPKHIHVKITAYIADIPKPKCDLIVKRRVVLLLVLLFLL